MALSDFLALHPGTEVTKVGPLWTISSNGRRLAVNSLFLRDDTEDALVDEMTELFADGHLPLKGSEA